jgi:hypothetical protein
MRADRIVRTRWGGDLRRGAKVGLCSSRHAVAVLRRDRVERVTLPGRKKAGARIAYRSDTHCEFYVANFLERPRRELAARRRVARERVRGCARCHADAVRAGQSPREVFRTSIACQRVSYSLEKTHATVLTMETGAFWDLGRVSDTQLRSGLSSLLANGCRTEARIIAHIAEVEQRKLHAKDGSPSLFEYCVRQLGLSESEAYHRLTAARIARQFPVVFSLIERRQLHLTAVCLLRDYLTPENHLKLLAEASNKTKLQVQELLARRFPRPEVASYVRKLPSRAVCAASGHPTRKANEQSPPPARPAEQVNILPVPALPISPPPTPGPISASSVSLPLPADSAPLRASIPAQTAPARARIEPTSEARYRIQLNASATLKEKLELSKPWSATPFQTVTSRRCSSGPSNLLWKK